MITLLCCGVSESEGSEKEMLCMGRVFCVAASVCGYTRFNGEVKGMLSRSFWVEALFAVGCLNFTVYDVLGKCHRVDVLCMLYCCHSKVSSHV